MAKTVNIHEAKTHLSRLLQQVRRGVTVTIAKAGEPVALLVPVGRSPSAGRVREPTSPSNTLEQDRARRVHRLLVQEVWPDLPEHERGRALTRHEEDAMEACADPAR